MRLLVQWSGGIESTSLLKWFLSNADHEVIAHKITVKGRHTGSLRLQQEEAAIEKLTPLLCSIRPFVVHRSEVSICGGSADLMERSLQWPMTIAALTYLHCDQTYRGMCREDVWDRQWINGGWHYSDANPVKDMKLRRKQWIERVLGGVLAADRMSSFDGRTVHDVAPWHETYEWPKADHCRYLGDLLPLTWSCRRPQEGEPCGQCHSCVERAAAVRGTSSVPAVATSLATRTACPAPTTP